VSTEKPPILTVLDTSTILLYTQGSDIVGELMSEVQDDGGVIGLPALCLAEADWMVGGNYRTLNLLVRHPGAEVIPVPDDWTLLARMSTIVGIQDAATAAVSALDYDCDVLTSRPGLYGGLEDGGPVNPISL
jgi:hypothetical protein